MQIIVIGGGPGGYVAAIRAAQLGAKVTLIEREHLGGTCLNIGCIPTKCLLHSAELVEDIKNQGKDIGVKVTGVEVDFPQVIAHKNAISKQLTGGIAGLFKANKIAKIDGEAKFVAPGKLSVKKADGTSEEMTADAIIVATGSVPRTMPMIPGFEKTMSFTELLKEKKEVGDKVLFFGGGQSSCEAAYDLILQGKHPIIVEYAGDLVAAQATCLANTSFLRDAMEYHKVPTYLHSTITEIHDGGVTVKGQDGKTFEVACDNVINGIGFVPAPVGDKGRHVHRVGDCVAIGNLRTVIWRAWDVCMKI